MVKRIIALLMATGMIVTMAACGGDETTDTPSTATPSVETVVSDNAETPDVAPENTTSTDVSQIESLISSELANMVGSQVEVPVESQNQLPVESQTQTQTPTESQTQAPTQSQTQTPTQSQTQTPGQVQSRPQTQAPTQSQTQTPGQVQSRPQTQAPTQSQTPGQVQSRPQTQAPTQSQTQTPGQVQSKPQTVAPTQSQTQTPTQSQTQPQQGQQQTQPQQGQQQTQPQQQPQQPTQTVSSQVAGTPSRVIGGGTVSTVTSNAGNATNQSGQNNITAAINLAGLKIKEGKSVIDGLDLGGKTFTMAITEEGQYHTQSFNRTVAAFEKQFNCKIKFETFTFANYNQQVAQRISAKKSPDICFVHGVNFPACAIDGMYNDITEVISTGDVMDSNNPAAGGIDMNKTSYFIYKNRIYGTCNFNSCFPYVIYYNKKQMADAGFSGNKDPRVLAERTTQWTWDFIRNLGRKLTTSDVYFLSNSFTGRGLPLSFGGNVTTVTNGVYKENVTSQQYMEALKFMQSITYGNAAITEPRDSAHAYNSYDTLLKGSVYLWTEETSKYLDISKEVKSSTAFGRDLNNLEITTMPLGFTNTKKAYPTGWLTAVASGKGTDPRVALAWDVFRSGYKDPVKGDNELDDIDQAFVDGLLKGNICCEIGCFGTSDMTTMTLTEGGVIQKIQKGDDISKCINEIKDQMTTCINQTIKK